MSLEQCKIAIQIVLPKEQIPAGTSFSILVRSLKGSVAISICLNIFEQKPSRALARILPDLDPSL